MNLIAVVFNQGSTLLSNMLIANVLGGSTFGKYVMVLSTLQYLSAFAGLGMGFTATRYVPEYRVRDPARAERVLGLCSLSTMLSGLFVATILLTAAPVVATHSLHAPSLETLLRIGSAVVLLTAVNGYFSGVLAGLERYPEVARAGVISGVLYTLLCVLGARFGGLEGAVIGLAASALAQALVMSVYYRRALRAARLTPSYHGLSGERAILGRWVVPGLLNGMTAIPALWLIQVALARQPGGFTELARYSAAYSLMAIVLFLPNVASNVGMSLINHARGARNSSDYHKVFWTNLQFSVGVVLLGAIGVAVAGPLLLRGYGATFRTAYPVLLVLLVATIPESLTIAMNQLIQTNDRIWASLFVINLPRDLLMPCLAFLLVPAEGAFGAALAYLGGRVLACIASTALCIRIGLSLHDVAAAGEAATSYAQVTP